MVQSATRHGLPGMIGAPLAWARLIAQKEFCIGRREPDPTLPGCSWRPCWRRCRRRWRGPRRARRSGVPAAPETRSPVDLERELQAPWQAGARSWCSPQATAARAPGAPALRAMPGRSTTAHGAFRPGAQAQPGDGVPGGAPGPAPFRGADRAAATPSPLRRGAVWLASRRRHLRLFNQGLLEYDRRCAVLPGRGPAAPLSVPDQRAAVRGPGQSPAQDVAVFPRYATTASAHGAAASIRMGLRVFRASST